MLKEESEIIKITESNFYIYKEDFKMLHMENMEHHLKNGKITKDYFEDKALELKDYLKEDKAVLFLAVINNQTIGCLWAYPKFFLDEKRLFIQLLQVTSNARNKGIGKKLLKKVESYAKDNSYDSLDLITSANNEGAQRLYNRMGYEVERVQLLKIIN